MNAVAYKQSEYFRRNREIWEYRFIKNWSLRKIASIFEISIEEIRESIAKQKLYFQVEYD